MLRYTAEAEYHERVATALHDYAVADRRPSALIVRLRRIFQRGERAARRTEPSVKPAHVR